MDKRFSVIKRRRKMDPSSPLAVFPAQISLRRPQNLRYYPLFERLFLLPFCPSSSEFVTESADAICVNTTACNGALPAKWV